MKKTILFGTFLFLVILISACSSDQTSDTTSKQELDNLKEELNVMKLNEMARNIEGKSFEGCVSSLECRGQGSSFVEVENSILCRFNCQDNRCVAIECKAR